MMKYLLAIGLSATLCSNAAAVVISSEFDAPGAQENRFGHADKVMHTDRGSKSGGPLIVYLPPNSAGPVQTQAPAHTDNVVLATLDEPLQLSMATPQGQSQPSVASQPSVVSQNVQPPAGFELPPQSNGKPPFLVDLPDVDLPETTGDSETPVQVTEPGTLALLGAGLLGLGLLRRRTSR